MIHILAAKDKGIDLKSFGTLLDEPPTGLVSDFLCCEGCSLTQLLQIFKKSVKIEKLQDIVGKRVGYIGHFGKVMVDDLARQAGIPQTAYQTVRVGMNVTDAIMRGEIDTGKE